MEENLWSLVSRTVNQSGGIEKAVFFLLLGFSLVSWCLMFVKFYDIYIARRNGVRFLEMFDGADRFGSIMNTLHTVGPSPLANIFKAGMGVLDNRRATVNVVSDPRQISVNPESSPEQMMTMNMQHTAGAEFAKLQKGLGFLATIGSTSPFIGLFGTVWGIMHTFRDLSNMKSASIAVVAPGISASLIATAAGLAVAIPAVMAYNWLLAQIEELEDQGDVFIERVQTIVHASGLMNTKPQPTAAAPAHVPAQFVAQPAPAPVQAPVVPSVSPTTLGAK